MAAKKPKPQLMPEQDVRRANDLLQERSIHLTRLAIARGCAPSGGNLGITLQGRYQDEDFVDKIRPHVCRFILDEIEVIDYELHNLGIEPSAIPEDPRYIKRELG